MPLAEGLRFGPYEIVAPLGAGGMGEVYKARDTRLDRSVAVKILPPTLAADPQFRERFDREARAISQLAHPHICALYDLGQAEVRSPEGLRHDPDVAQGFSPAERVDYLVLEYLEGETLAARLEKGALPIEQALKTAVEIASALDAAHRAGIVHRDLKPGNVMLTKAGAKLLDFGLAKTTGPAIATSGLSTAPTTPPATMTAAGTILGTFQYMAPEQIEGIEADARTDLFAFGCVLYEMLTGKKAFEGKTRASLLGAILKDEPPPVSKVVDARADVSRSTVPPALDRLVATCLAKDPDDRWQTARDLMRELQWVAGAAGSAAHAQASQSPARHRAPVAAILATAIITGGLVAAAVGWFLRPTAVPRTVVRLQAQPPAAAPVSIDAIAPDLALSPDGRYLVYTGTGQAQLYLRALEQLEATPLAGTTNVRGPFFSPDGEWIGFFQGSDLRKVSVRGGPSLTICRECAGGNRGATWGTDDSIVFSAFGGTQGLRRVPAAGGDPVVLTTLDMQKGEQSHMWPEFLPGNDAIVFTIAAAGGIDNASVTVRDLQTGVQQALVRGGSQAHYVPTGHLVYAAGGTLRAIRFDASRRSVTGSPVPVLERVLTKSVGSADFSVSRGGSLAYISGDLQAATQRLAWVDRQGQEEPIPAPPRAYFYLRLSPDGQRVAVDIRDSQQDIWIWDFSRRALTRLTNDPNLDQSPVWTPDGRRVVFASQRAGIANLFWQPADGTGTAERLTTSPQVQIPWTFAPDGTSPVLRDTDPKTTGSNLSVMSMEGQRVPKPLIHTSFNEGNAELSPDGRWIAYQSDESGRIEVHVRPYPLAEAGHWQISIEGGSRPVWARNGRELFFVNLAARIMAVPVQAGSSFSVGNPVPTAVDVAGIGGLGRGYDISPDGRRFIVIRNVRSDDKASPPQLNIVLNWDEELERLVPVKR